MGIHHLIHMNAENFCHIATISLLPNLLPTSELCGVGRLCLIGLLDRYVGGAHLSFEIVYALLQLVDLGSHFI